MFIRPTDSPPPPMHADVKTLHRSPNFRVLDYHCRMEPESVSHPEYAPSFAISFTRRGRFGYRVDRQVVDIDSRHVLLSNAGSEFVFTHGRDVCDVCTIVHVDEGLLDDAQRTYWRKEYVPKRTVGTARRFLFPNPVVASSPGLDVAHRHLYEMTRNGHARYSRLQADELLVHLVETVFRSSYRWTPLERPPVLQTPLMQRHFETVERARQFMLTNFEAQLSLDDVARAAWASPFHLSRIFKRITGYRPHEYLVGIRLNHAALLLRHTAASVTEICFACGFNGLSHFSDTFTRYFLTSPTSFRRD